MKDWVKELDNMTEEELIAEMEAILEEVNNDPTLQNVQVPEGMYEQIMDAIREKEEKGALRLVEYVFGKRKNG